MRKGIISVMSVMTLVLASCVKENEAAGKKGSLFVQISSEVEISVQTKSDTFDDYNVYLNGTRTDQGDYNQSLTYAQMLEGCTLPYGVYSVEAENCTAVEAVEGLGCARFYGKTEGVKVMSPEPVTVPVDCRMVNAKAQIIFDETLLSEFDQGSVDASMTVGGRTIDVSSTEPAAAYFNVDASGSVFTYVISGEIAGVALSYTGELLLRPAKFAKITIKSNHNGALGPGVSVQDETEVGVVELPGEIDINSGQEITGGSIVLPVIYVDYEINPNVEDIDCVLDIIK